MEWIKNSLIFWMHDTFKSLKDTKLQKLWICLTHKKMDSNRWISLIKLKWKTFLWIIKCYLSIIINSCKEMWSKICKLTLRMLKLVIKHQVEQGQLDQRRWDNLARVRRNLKEDSLISWKMLKKLMKKLLKIKKKLKLKLNPKKFKLRHKQMRLNLN